jgi:hypothetical protein
LTNRKIFFLTKEKEGPTCLKLLFGKWGLFMDDWMVSFCRLEAKSVCSNKTRVKQSEGTFFWKQIKQLSERTFSDHMFLEDDALCFKATVNIERSSCKRGNDKGTERKT